MPLQAAVRATLTRRTLRTTSPAIVSAEQYFGRTMVDHINHHQQARQPAAAMSSWCLWLHTGRRLPAPFIGGVLGCGPLQHGPHTSDGRGCDTFAPPAQDLRDSELERPLLGEMCRDVREAEEARAPPHSLHMNLHTPYLALISP